MELQNRVAVVTGGASGLGRATVEAFLARGARVVIFDLNRDAGTKTAAELGGHCQFEAVNVAEEASVKAAIERVLQQTGALHIAVNCAGIGSAIKTYGSRGPHPLAEFQKVIGVNLVGTFNVARLAAEAMAANDPVTADGERGVIINTASVAAFDGQVGQVAYSASKGGVVGMTLPMARDLAPQGIRVNVIAPGIFNTPLMNAAPDAVKGPLIQMTQFPKRLGQPAEYARLACEMVENGFFNGEVVRLDGGIRMAAR
ncbi:MAG: SDR family NAD(P)-dependent oxidoreductase [Pseudomonadota bacterium]|nr:3-hydroxyacyl-CoA dehydrogenase [Pseudomonadales bacterium]MDY6922026.1 SDR family NAD(P)-dependent oxidoreductase [Pseudomonadota bacterium]